MVVVLPAPLTPATIITVGVVLADRPAASPAAAAGRRSHRPAAPCTCGRVGRAALLAPAASGRPAGTRSPCTPASAISSAASSSSYSASSICAPVNTCEMLEPVLRRPCAACPASRGALGRVRRRLDEAAGSGRARSRRRTAGGATGGASGRDRAGRESRTAGAGARRERPRDGAMPRFRRRYLAPARSSQLRDRSGARAGANHGLAAARGAAGDAGPRPAPVRQGRFYSTERRHRATVVSCLKETEHAMGRARMQARDGSTQRPGTPSNGARESHDILSG